jgi:hypothetical protein
MEKGHQADVALISMHQHASVAIWGPDNDTRSQCSRPFVAGLVAAMSDGPLMTALEMKRDCRICATQALVALNIARDLLAEANSTAETARKAWVQARANYNWLEILATNAETTVERLEAERNDRSSRSRSPIR